MCTYQVCFYAWGFYALGHDDTLEVKLTGQAVRTPVEPSVAGLEEGGMLNDGGAITAERTVVNSVVAVSAQVEDSMVAGPPGGLLASDPNLVNRGSGNEYVKGVQQPVAVVDINGGIVAPPSAEATPQMSESRVSGAFATASCSCEYTQQLTMAGDDNAMPLDAAKEGRGGSGALARVWQQRIRVVLVSPNIIAVAVGAIIAMISSLQDLLFNDAHSFLHPLGSALEVR